MIVVEKIAGSGSGRHTYPIHLEYECLLKGKKRVLCSVTRYQVLSLVDGLRSVKLISNPCATLLKELIGTISARNYQEGGLLTVFAGNKHLSRELGRSIKTISVNLRKLRDEGYVTMKDSPNYSRRGVKTNGVGEVIEAYGIDLSILVVRYEELKSRIVEIKAVLAAMDLLESTYNQLVRQVAVVLKRVMDVKVYKDYSSLIQSIGPARKASEEGLKTGILKLKSMLNTLLKGNIGVEKTGSVITTKESENNNNSKQEPTLFEEITTIAEEYYVNAFQTVKKDLFSNKRSNSLLTLFSKNIQIFTSVLNINYNTIMRAWNSGMTAQEIAICLAIMYEKKTTLSSPGGYFHAMVRKWQTKSLNLTQSIHALAHYNTKKIFEKKANKEKKSSSESSKKKVSAKKNSSTANEAGYDQSYDKSNAITLQAFEKVLSTHKEFRKIDDEIPTFGEDDALEASFEENIEVSPYLLSQLGEKYAHFPSKPKSLEQSFVRTPPQLRAAPPCGPVDLSESDEKKSIIRPALKEGDIEAKLRSSAEFEESEEAFEESIEAENAELEELQQSCPVIVDLNGGVRMTSWSEFREFKESLDSSFYPLSDAFWDQFVALKGLKASYRSLAVVLQKCFDENQLFDMEAEFAFVLN